MCMHDDYANGSYYLGMGELQKSWKNELLTSGSLPRH